MSHLYVEHPHIFSTSAHRKIASLVTPITVMRISASHSGYQCDLEIKWYTCFIDANSNIYVFLSGCFRRLLMQNY